MTMSKTRFFCFTNISSELQLLEITLVFSQTFMPMTLIQFQKVRSVVLLFNKYFYQSIYFSNLNIISGNSQPNLTSGQVNRDNVITIQVQSSYRESDIKIDSLPRLLIDHCDNKNILELEYLRLVDESISG